MRILVIGGTRLLGRQIVRTALDRGHDVTIFNRGRTDPEAFPEATRLVGDRHGDLAPLLEREWDATIDVCGYASPAIRWLLTTLGPRTGHYTFISTISVFNEFELEDDFTESAGMFEPDWSAVGTMEKYAEQKVACELVARELAGDHLLIIRPGYVIGRFDYTERFTHWVRTVMAGEPFVGPDPDQPLQCIDARDIARFIIGCVEAGRVDDFNVTAPQNPPSFVEVLATVALALDVDLPDVRWTEAAAELPLSIDPDAWAAMRADVSKALGAGLRWRPLEESVQDIAAWLEP